MFRKNLYLFFIFFTLVSTINFNTLSNNSNDKITSLKNNQLTNKDNELEIDLSNFLNFIKKTSSETILPLHLKLNKEIATLYPSQREYLIEGLLFSTILGIFGFKKLSFLTTLCSFSITHLIGLNEKNMLYMMRLKDSEDLNNAVV